MKKNHLFIIFIFIVFISLFSCKNENRDLVEMEIDFDWQMIDQGSKENPEIRIKGVPLETTKFYVGLVDLNNNGFDHGGGFVEHNGTGIIDRGSTKGSYNGPDPPFPNLIHTMEITVEAYDKNGNIIGIGKKTKKFPPQND